MTKLSKCRATIDKIDDKIIKLYEKRMDAVKCLTEYKIANDIPIEDKNRETIMLENNLSKIKHSDYVRYYHEVLAGFLNASKHMQKDIKDKN